MRCVTFFEFRLNDCPCARGGSSAIENEDTFSHVLRSSNSRSNSASEKGDHLPRSIFFDGRAELQQDPLYIFDRFSVRFWEE